jgi:hypothetical protein
MKLMNKELQKLRKDERYFSTLNGKKSHTGRNNPAFKDKLNSNAVAATGSNMMINGGESS